MKTRSGFVSNSSSSSFVLITTVSVAEQAKKSLSPYEKAVVNFIEKQLPEFCDAQPVMYSVVSGNDDNLEWFDQRLFPKYGYKAGSDENEVEGPHEAWRKFRGIVQQIGVGKIIQHSESW